MPTGHFLIFLGSIRLPVGFSVNLISRFSLDLSLESKGQLSVLISKQILKREYDLALFNSRLAH